AQAPRYADWNSRVLPEDRDRVNAHVRAVLDGPEAEFRTEFRVVSRQGEVRWLLGLGRVERDGDGQPLRMSGLNLDITERKRAEVALRESEERLRLALSGGKMGMWEWDMQSGLCVWNAMEHELLGLNLGDCRPSTELYFRYVHPEDLAPLRRSLDEVGPERPDWKDEFRIIRADGALRWVAAIGKTHYHADGRPERMVGVNFDITERKQAEEALRQAHAQLNDRAGHLESLVQQRTVKLQTAIGELEAFSYSVAHDLRAPLRAMEGYARELLNESSLSPQGQTYLVRIQRAAARMDRLTQDVLAYSRISQEKIKLAPVELDRLAHELVEQYPGISAHCERIDIQSPLLPVLGHEGLLTQALSNLLTNACKFVAPGASPEVVVGTEPIGEEVRIWVGDKGIGIAAEHRHRIFEMFGFGRIHPDHKYEGTGIGLAIVKKAAERMGGTVGFDSEPGKGSRFWIQLNRSKP
ncbi:MAG: sensor histidine kinase, partial [Limisphaerales bacterium]